MFKVKVLRKIFRSNCAKVMWGCVSNSFNYELCCYQYLTNIVLGDYSEGKIKCRNACHGHEKWGTNKRY